MRRSALETVVALCVVMAAACGGSDDEEMGPDAGVDPGTLDPGASDPGTDPGTDPGAHHGDPNDPASTAGNNAKNDFYPLAVGRRLEFVTSEQLTYRIDVVDYGIHAERYSYEVHHTKIGLGTIVSYEYNDGGSTYAFFPGFSTHWGRWIEGPPELGDRWAFDLWDGLWWRAHQFSWEYQGKITVPAGAYDGCMRLVDVTDPIVNYTVYCPGVGPVYRVHGWHTRSLVNITTTL
jgi:hypothetical protein